MSRLDISIGNLEAGQVTFKIDGKEVSQGQASAVQALLGGAQGGGGNAGGGTTAGQPAWVKTAQPSWPARNQGEWVLTLDNQKGLREIPLGALSASPTPKFASSIDVYEKGGGDPKVAIALVDQSGVTRFNQDAGAVGAKAEFNIGTDPGNGKPTIPPGTYTLLLNFETTHQTVGLRLVDGARGQ